MVLHYDQCCFSGMSCFVCRLHSLTQTVFRLLQTSNHNPLHDLREEWEIQNRAVVAKIGNVKALFLQQRFVDGFFQVELLNDSLVMLVMTGIITDACCLMNDVGMGSRLQVARANFLMISRISS